MAIDFDSLDKTQKVLTFGAPQNNKTYPVQINVWDRDKQPPALKHITSQVEIKDGEGKLPSDMYKHVGMGAKIKVDGKLVTFESKKSENFDITFSHNRFNIIGKIELSQDNSRQSEQDNIALIDKIIDDDRRESLNRRHIIARVMQFLQNKTMQRSSKNATGLLSIDQIPTGTITVEKMISMNAHHDEIDNFIEKMEQVAKKNCDLCNEFYKQSYTENVNESEKRAYEAVASQENISQNDLNAIISTNSKQQKEIFEKTNDIDLSNKKTLQNDNSEILGVINAEIPNNLNTLLQKENPEKQIPEIIFNLSSFFDSKTENQSTQNPQNASLIDGQDQIKLASNPEEELDITQSDEDKLTTRERHKLFKDGFIDKHPSHNHHEDMDKFNQMLNDKLEDFTQSQEQKVAEFKQNYDSSLNKEYDFFTVLFREEMRFKLYEKSRALMTNKSLTPEERKKKLLAEHEKIKKQQKKELAKRIMLVNRQYARFYTELLVNIAKGNEAFIKDLKNYSLDSHEYEHMPILGAETEQAFQHLKQDTENAIKKAKELYTTLQTQNKSNEAEDLAKKAKACLGIDLANEADQTRDTNQESMSESFTQSTTPSTSNKQPILNDSKTSEKTTFTKKSVQDKIWTVIAENTSTIDFDKISEQSGFELPHTASLVKIYQQALGAKETSKEEAQQTTSKLRTRRRASLDIEAMAQQAQPSQFKGA